MIENLASSVENLASLQQNKDENAEDRLRYVLAKMKIAHNAILQEKSISFSLIYVLILNLTDDVRFFISSFRL